MASFSKISLIGNVGNDPIAKTVEDKKLVEFSIAINDPLKKEDKPTWYRISVWGNRADVISNYVRKGHLIHVEGRLQVRNYVDGEGKERYSLEVIASDFTLLSTKDVAATPAPSSSSYVQQAGATAAPAAEPPASIPPAFSNSKVSESEADDLPF